MAPDAPARALAPNGQYNTGENLGTGPVLQLLHDHPTAAVVAPLRAGLVVLDLDGTLDLLPHLQDAAADVGAALVYLAASGSPDSAHAVYACPTAHGRAHLLAQVDTLRSWAGVGTSALAVRSAREVLRMPGTVSLKPGCGPVTPAVLHRGGLVSMSPADALQRALDALHAVGWAPAPAGGRQALQRALDALDALQPAVETPPAVELASTGGLLLDAHARAALHAPARAGTDRSLHALRAAWHLWRCGGRTWADVARVVMTAPALARWRARGPKDAQRRWKMEAAKWATLPAPTPRLATEDAGLLQAAHEHAHLLPPHLEAAAVVVLQRMRTVGRTDGVGVSQRCLVVEGVATSRTTAGRLLQGLVAHGVLQRARRWEDGPLADATLWTLQPVDQWELIGATSGPSGTHPLGGTPGDGSLTHPVWLAVGHAARRAWAVLQAGRLPTAGVADALGVAVRTVRRWLSTLQAAGLVVACRVGRSVVWVARSLRRSSAARVAVVELRARRAAVAAERSAWRELVGDVGPVAVSGVEGVEMAPMPTGGAVGRVAAVWARLRATGRRAGGVGLVAAAAGRAADAFQAAAGVLGAAGGGWAPAGVGVASRAGAWAGGPHRGHGPAPPGLHPPIDLTNMMEETTL